MSGLWKASVLSVVAACALVPGATAETCALTCTAVGVDDNTITLNPGTPTFTSDLTWLQNALNTNDNVFNGLNWNFSLASQLIDSSDLINQIYSGWVVTNDPITGFNGKQYSRPVQNQDAGGANFEVAYSNISNDGGPLPGNVDFLQVFRQSINGGAYEYFIDNGGDTETPFYVGSGGVGGVGGNTTTVDNRPAAWMLDIPFDCENGLTGPDDNNPCAGGTDEDRLSADVQFQVFVATVDQTDSNGQTINNVTLYGGEQWGYLYQNTDTPEPSSLGLFGSLLMAGIVFVARRRTRRAAPGLN